jgi:pentatricopeptide repeat protein
MLAASARKETRRSFENLKLQADRIFRILLQDGSGFSARQALGEMCPRVSNELVREVLFRIIVSVDNVNRERFPKLAYKFFVWTGLQEGYQNNTSMYSLVMKVFAECGEVKAMWRLFEEMAEKGQPVSARTFHLLICSSGQIGFEAKACGEVHQVKHFQLRV